MRKPEPKRRFYTTNGKTGKSEGKKQERRFRYEKGDENRTIVLQLSNKSEKGLTKKVISNAGNDCPGAFYTGRERRRREQTSKRDKVDSTTYLFLKNCIDKLCLDVVKHRYNMCASHVSFGE